MGLGTYLKMKASYTATPKTFDESFIRSQAPQVDMEAFYASLDAGTHFLSRSCDESATTAPSEEARKALKIVQDFISNDASVLLHRQKCSVVKASLDYLSNLSADDGISGEMKTLISEASWLFTHWSRDYTEACMKIESTTSELHRADESEAGLEAGLEANKNQFWDVVAWENKLEEKINVIKAELSACESEKNMAIQRKGDIFEEGKTLMAQIDKLREKMPHLQHEQGLAKKTQAKITSEWSNLREKFKTTVVDGDV